MIGSGNKIFNSYKNICKIFFINNIMYSERLQTGESQLVVYKIIISVSHTDLKKEYIMMKNLYIKCVTNAQVVSIAGLILS
jgi:hypothetical protein